MDLGRPAVAIRKPCALRVVTNAPSNSEEQVDADVTDNLIEQTAGTLAEVSAAPARGEVMFSSNRCSRLDDPRNVAQVPAVILAGAHVIVTGNRVRALAVPSLDVTATDTLTAVGNITSGDAAIHGAPPLPAGAMTDYPTYNGIT